MTCDYHTYLGISNLLEAGATVLPADVPRSIRLDELHFRRIHQLCELVAAQFLADLDQAAATLRPPGDHRLALHHLARAAAILELLTPLTRLLGPPYFTADHFQTFRALLGTASGAQSRQFHLLRTALGLEKTQSPVYHSFRDAALRARTTVAASRDNPNHPLHDIGKALIRIATAYRAWQQEHLRVARHVIGDRRPGTGGTSGTRYLMTRIATPFPDLLP